MYGLHRECRRPELKQLLRCRHLQTALNPKHSPPSTVIPSTPKPPAPTPSSLSNPKLEHLVKSNFPKSRLCFAYGSKVLHQLENLPTASTMTDLIFVTDNPAGWHEENFKTNKHHYSLMMRLLGPRGVALVQDIKPYCFFNPFVEVDGVLLKYGVISETHLLKDLQSWDTLYIAGRLHKPVLVLQQDPAFRGTYITRNLRSALHTALLFLPERFSDIQLFTVICNISYCGDVRSLLKVENPNKVRNIVEPNVEHFRNLYKSIIDESPFIERTDYGYCQAAKTEKNLRVMEKLLPPKLLYVPEDGSRPHSRTFPFDEKIDTKHQLLRKVAVGDYRYTEEQIQKILFVPSIVQSFKGVLTAGLLKSFMYSKAKLKKANPKSVALTKSTSSDNLSLTNREGQLMSTEYSVYRYSLSWKNADLRKNIVLLIAMTMSALLYISYREEYLQKEAGL